MISNPNTPIDTNTFESSSPLGFDLRGMLVPYLKKWYWFALCIAIFVSLAYMKIRYTIPQYNVSSTIMIAQDESVTGSELAAFKDLGLLQNAQESKLENEIQVLKSRTLITNIVNDLKLNVRYFSEGRILEVENYPKSLIEINFLSHDSIVHTKSATFNVRINSSTSFTFLDKEGTKLSDHSFGNTVTTNIGDVVITPSVDNLDTHSGKVIKIVVTPVKFVVEAYRNKLAVFPARGSSIVGISLNDPVREKAKDIINNLVDEYNIATVESKKQISARTANFINERLDLISGDLSEVDDEAAGYKSKFGLTSDVDAQTQRVADIDSRNVQEIAQLSTQINLIESMRRFVLSQDGRYDLIPANLGFADASITNTVTRYNGLTLQRKRLLKTSSEQNPVVVNIDQQIDGLRQVLIGSLNSLKSSIDIRLKSLRTQDQYFSGKLYNAPIREKDLRVIEREQTIKEQLYLYLLQKREEAELTSHITVSSARVIDRASTLNSYPVSPNKKIIYAGALFLGFILPFMTIYLSDLLNVKISSREDLEKVLSMPIIGSIPKVKAKNKIIISKNERSGAAEAFRILRTNLDFLMAGTTKSSISGEGKTMISSNLTKTLSITGKKVIYLGTDLRDPKFHKFVDLPEGVNTKGLTNYIMDTELSPVDIIYKDKEENSFDFIPSGAIPPNPAELLMHDRVGEIFEYLKENYDYVVVDTSPVSLVADTLLIGHFADLCIYIVRENYSDKKLLQIPQNFYKDKRLPNIAVLLNSAGSQAGYNYGYGYGKKS